MSPALTAAVLRTGSRRIAGALPFGWRKRGWSRPGRRGVTTMAALALYLAAFVSVPAWHDHAHHHHDEPATSGHAHAGHAHTEHAHAGHVHAEHGAPKPKTDHAEEPADHECRVCELLGTGVVPVAPPAVADLTGPLPARFSPTVPVRRAVFLSLWNARGPPRG